VKTGGGGGFGSPDKRSRDDIKEDKKQGYVS
jgi:N-methylhydantoinase B/oxoprolinase/acetone carboxylase alpha subunit